MKIHFRNFLANHISLLGITTVKYEYALQKQEDTNEEQNMYFSHQGITASYSPAYRGRYTYHIEFL